jgi:hypothetical protein
MTFEWTGMGRSLGWALVFGLLSCGGATAGGSAEPGSESPVASEPSHTSEPGTAAPLLGEGGLEATWQELGVAGVSNRPDLASTPAGWLALSRRFVGDPRVPSAEESYLYRSSDGIRWQRVEVSDRNDDLWLRGVAYGAGRYVLAGSRFQGPGGSIFTSDDGDSWLESSIGIYEADAEQLRDVSYAGGRFFVFGTSGTVLGSVDGSEWLAIDLRRVVFPWMATFGGGRYLMVGSGAPQFSVDGTSWRPAPLDCSLPGGCIQNPSGQVGMGFHTHAVYAGGRYFIDQATSTGDAAWQALPGLYPEAEVDGYVLGRSEEDALVAWAPEEPARPLRSVRYVDTLSDAERLERMRWNGSIEPREVTFENFPNGAAVPESLEFPLRDGADCNTARCVLVGDRLFLVATSP